MPAQQTISFQEALEIIESLPEYQQEDLIHIIRHRLIEQKRQLLAENIKEAREEYTRGEVKRGTVDDLIKELSE
jgi:cation transport regulator ChaB